MITISTLQLIIFYINWQLILFLKGGKSMKENRVSRRQFLNYTLGGVGGFLVVASVLPMARFAIDPVLQASDGGDFIPTDMKMSDITEEPVRVNFTYEQVDAWYESEVTETAWVYRNEEGEVVALSPICTHLGCTVNWEGDPDAPEQFFCPCHNGYYTKDGKNVANTPPPRPLDIYPHTEKDGYLQLGKAKRREA